MKRLVSLVLACALAPGCFSLDEDGDGLIDVRPPTGDEVNDITCADGRDNDYDGRIDCQDTDCLMRGFCGEQIPLVPRLEPEDTPGRCVDGIDNDEDGQFDCGDRGCQGIMELCCNAEIDDASCSNRIDEDGNGFADCTDFSCRNNQFVSVCESELQCVKLDAAGRLIPCTTAEQEEARDRQCTDGFDNDGDRRTDCNDPECGCTEVCHPGCAGPEDTVERCLDGQDNDGNGYADCADRACYNPGGAAAGVAAEQCAARAENTEERCEDGIDNDENGYVDCRDFGCNEWCSGGGQPEAGFAACTDGIDNDGNGYRDCDDNSCRFSSDNAVREACESTVTSCRDHRDNNENGFTDCADFSCRFYQCNLGGDCDPSVPPGSDPSTPGACPIGQSCFDSGTATPTCIRVTSPCFEGAYLGGDYEELSGCPLRSDLNPEDPDYEEKLQALVRAQQAQVYAGCTDGVDNDQDGFTDEDDWDCNHNPLAVDVGDHDGDGDRADPLYRGNDGRPLVCQ